MRCTKDSNALLLKGLKNSGEVCRSIITTLECIREEVIYGHILELFVLIFGPHGSLEVLFEISSNCLKGAIVHQAKLGNEAGQLSIGA